MKQNERSAAKAYLIAGAVLLALAGPATAQEPQHTAETFGNWTVECNLKAGPPLQKTCDMSQLVEVKGQSTPIARAMIGHPPNGQTMRFEVQLPVNIWIPAGMKMQFGEKDPGVAFAFTHCIPGGCFASADLRPDLLAKLRSSGIEAKMHFVSAGQQQMVIPLGLNGFGQAFDTLSKE